MKTELVIEIGFTKRTEFNIKTGFINKIELEGKTGFVRAACCVKGQDML